MAQLGTSNISTTVVANILGINTHNVRELCTSDNINKWAKYKPVGYNSVAPDRSGTWYRGTDGNCGINVGNISAGDSVSDLIQNYKNGAYTYIPPKGGASEPYRLADFGGYDHNAKQFFYSGIIKGTKYTVNLTATNTLVIQGSYNSSDSSLGIEDFHQLGEGLQDAHLAVHVFSNNPLEAISNKLLYTFIADDSIKQNGAVTLEFTDGDLHQTMYGVLYLQSPTVSNQMCIPYDDDNYFLFEISITRLATFGATLQSYGVLGKTLYSPTYYQNNALQSDNGNADIIFNISINNDNHGTIVITGNDNRSGYTFRVQVHGSYYTLQLCDVNGNSMPSVTVSNGSVANLYFRADDLFKTFVSSFGSVTQLNTEILIQTRNTTSSASGWEVIAGPYDVLVSK